MKRAAGHNLVLAGAAAKDTTAMEQGCGFRRLSPAAAIAQASSLANHNRLSTTFDHLTTRGPLRRLCDLTTLPPAVVTQLLSIYPV
ncbi:hypothetical protein [Yersinia rohdei]|uniref:hypothetical protein n=1 Tax=Yersinia rohdei TaxID=29485 RepID=UPI0006D43177|nr:hypothetical protein [Yersinia rohdei]